MDEKFITTPAPVSVPSTLRQKLRVDTELAEVSKNFLGLEEEYAGFKKSKAVVVSIPYDKTTTYVHGAKNGPRAIIDASRYLELYDDELNQETYRIGIHTMAALEVENLPSEDMIKAVHSSCAEVLKSNKFPVLLGGEHSLSIGAVLALKESYANLSVLQLDAHNDLKNEYFGSHLNHGCVGRRISEICPLVQAGTRSMSKEEKDFIASQANGKVRAFSVYDILEKPMWKNELVRNLTENVYVTIDLDVFDPSLMPAVGTPEPGGIGWYETLDLLREVTKDKRIVGFDIVELCPIEGQVASDFLAAKLAYRLLGYVFTNKK